VTTNTENLENREMRSFHGFCTYYRRFIAGSEDIPKPLIKLTEKKRTSQMSLEAEATLRSLKKPLCAVLVLAYHRLGQEFVNTNANYMGT
jgi:hypothetical protein